MSAHSWLVLSTLALGAPLIGQPESKFSQVTFEFVFGPGDRLIDHQPIKGRLIVDSDNGRSYDATVTREITIRLPYGDHRVSFIPDGFRETNRLIAVDQPEHFYVIPLSVGDAIPLIDNAGPTKPILLRAQIAPLKTCNGGEFLWAKLIGVYTDYSEIQRIRPDGSVTFQGESPDLYMLLILDGSEVRASRVLLGGTTQIKLSDCEKLEPH